MLLVALALFTRASIELPSQNLVGRQAARSAEAAPVLHPGFAAPEPAAMTDRTHPRVRPLDDDARAIVSASETSSATVAQLLNALEASDVVVYVQTGLDTGMRARTTFIAYGRPLTYLLVRIDLNQGPRERGAALAHELTHALEVSEASPPVRSEGELAALYRRIGERGATNHDFESTRAVANEKLARAELTRSTSTRQD